MSAVGLIGAIVIGLVAGWLAERIIKRGHGLLANLAVGLGGALIGGFLAHTLGVDYFNGLVGLVGSALAAAVLLALLGAIKR